MFWHEMDYSLDFKTFAIAQPNASTTQCDSDYFQVGGVVNDVPLICGDNDNQHSESSDTNTRPNRYPIIGILINFKYLSYYS